MKALTPDRLRLSTDCSEFSAKEYAGPLDLAMMCNDISNDHRQAHFLAQIAHESARLSRLEENLNYSAKGLLGVFGKYFDAQTAEAYARKPEKIASRVYANRMGNGDEATGDGWRFRGRGFIQLTGRDNYKAAGKALGHELETCPDLLLTPDIAAQSAAWFWQTRGLNQLADAGELEAITKRINGGLTGLQDRLYFLQRAKAALTF